MPSRLAPNLSLLSCPSSIKWRDYSCMSAHSSCSDSQNTNSKPSSSPFCTVAVEIMIRTQRLESKKPSVSCTWQQVFTTLLEDLPTVFPAGQINKQSCSWYHAIFHHHGQPAILVTALKFKEYNHVSRAFLGNTEV